MNLSQHVFSSTRPREADSISGRCRLIDADHSDRRRVEQFIADRFFEVHGARVSSFMPVLVTLFDCNDNIHATVGLRDAADAVLFLEYYLDSSVEWVIERKQEYTGPAIDRRASLRKICEEVVAAYAFRAQTAGVHLVFHDPAQECPLNGVHSLVSSLVSNLVDNAIKYSSENGRVEISCNRAGSRLLLSVDDSGPGLDAETRGKAAERFFRADSTDTSGAGLGLAIAQSIAEVHGANMVLTDSRLGGLSVQIEFDID